MFYTHILLFTYVVITYTRASSNKVPYNHDFLSGSDSYSNLTHKQLSALLQHKGYKVVEFEDSPPLALDGNVAYEADQVLPELAWPKGRADSHGVQEPYLWIDEKTGKAELLYFYDTKNPPNIKDFQKVVKNWSDSTCIKFTKIEDRRCSVDATFGAVCVGDFTHCFSNIGNAWKTLPKITRKRKIFQKASMIGCGLYDSTQMVGHSVGFDLYHMRRDRDQYITINPRNSWTDFTKGAPRQTWSSALKCEKGRSYQTSIPLPYDFLSVMGYGENDGGDMDNKVIYVAKDPRLQYMLDYKKNSGMTLSHFDMYATNLMYKCNAVWAQTCIASGTTPPKCKNYGYLQRNCKCACPNGIKGSACEQNDQGTLFPPLERAETVVEYPGPGQFTLKDYSHMQASLPPNKEFTYIPEFKYTQYATIVLKGKDEKTLASVRVFEPGEVSQHIAKNSTTVNNLIDTIPIRDCHTGMRLHWGDFPRGMIRTECLTTFVTNEPEENAVVLRSKNYTMGIVIIARQGEMMGSAEFTVLMLEKLQFHVSFPVNARIVFKVKTKNDNPPAIDADGPVIAINDSAAAMTGVAAGLPAMLMMMLAQATMLVAIIACVMVSAICLICFLLCRKKKTKDEDSLIALDSLEESGSEVTNSDDDDSD